MQAEVCPKPPSLNPGSAPGTILCLEANNFWCPISDINILCFQYWFASTKIKQLQTPKLGQKTKFSINFPYSFHIHTGGNEPWLQLAKNEMAMHQKVWVKAYHCKNYHVSKFWMLFCLRWRPANIVLFLTICTDCILCNSWFKLSCIFNRHIFCKWSVLDSCSTACIR